MAQTIGEWVLGRIDAGAIAFRVRVGTGAQLQTAGVLVLAEHAGAWSDANDRDDYAAEAAEDGWQMSEAVAALADSAGWPSEAPTVRVHSYALVDGKRREGMTLQRTTRASDTSRGADRDTGSILADALATQTAAMVRLVNAHTAGLEAMSRTLEHRESMGRELIGDLVDALRGQNEAEAAAAETVIDHLVEDLEAKAQQGDDDQAGPAAELIRGLLRKFGLDDAPNAVDAILGDEGAIDAIIDDPRAQDAFAAAMHRKAARDAQRGQTTTTEEG